MQGEIVKRAPRSQNLTSQSLARFLLFSMVVMGFFVTLNFYLNLIPIALIQGTVLLTLPFLYSWLKKGAPHGIIRHLIGFDLLFVFVPLLFIPTADETGVYWIFGYPLIAFFFLGTVTGLQWSVAYCLFLLVGVGLSQVGFLTLHYTWLQTGLAFVETVVFIAIGYLFVSDREKAENLHLSHLHYLESLERIERALHADLDLEKCMNSALLGLLNIFDCSRAWLLFPANADTKNYTIPFEQTRPEYPGLHAEQKQVVTDKVTSELFKVCLESGQPVCQGENSPSIRDSAIAKELAIRSRMAISLNRDTDQPWLLGLHQCDTDRVWNRDEQRLFQDIAKRMEDALNQMLLYRELAASESNLRNAIIQAEAASHAKSEFLSTMSHELRTPLHGIIGLQELIAADTDNLSPEQRENLALAQQSAKSLRALVNDVLDLAKIESGSMELVQEEFQLFDCIRDAIVPFIISARDKGLTLSLQINNAPATIVGDEARLRQVLLNLIGNAVKFTDKGAVSVQVETEHRKLHFKVSDTGIGIPPENIGSIFDPFTQVKRTPSSRQLGTGLGTSIVKRFVELMNGTISVESRVDEGSNFVFVIPCKAVGQESISTRIDATGDNLNIAPQIRSRTNKTHASKLKALLAEDDPIGRRIAVKLLTKAGIEVDAVDNGNSAWDLIQNNHYHLLLTDIRMPDLSGIELTQRIRKMEKKKRLPHLPIIGLSAHALEEVVHDCLQSGMDHFMTKPVDPASILAAVSQKTSSREN